MTLRERAANWLREPLVHFLLVGAVIYAVLATRPPNAGERRIVVNENVVSRLVDRWSQAFRRNPTPAEIDGLVRDYVKEEVYYREALRLGLDRDDEAVRRLMRNKLVATATAEAEASRPTDAQLEALLRKDPDRYGGDSVYDLTQVFLGEDTPAVRSRAPAALASLARGDPPAEEVRLPIPRDYLRAPASVLAAQFGDAFVATLDRTRPGTWSGPVASELGLHLIRISRRDPPPPPRLADVRQRLENDWRAEAISAAEDRNYRELLQGYDVVIEAR